MDYEGEEGNLNLRVKSGVPVSPFVVIPRHNLHKIVLHRKPRCGIENTGPAVPDELTGHEVLLAVSQHALHLPFGLLANGFANILVRNASVQPHRQIHQRRVRSRNAERHAADLAVERRDQATHGLGGCRGTRNQVETSRGPAAPELQGWTCHALLRRCNRTKNLQLRLLATTVMNQDGSIYLSL